MRRRDMTLCAAAAAFAGRAAARGRMRRIGVLWGGTFSEPARQRATRQRQESGAVEGRDFVPLVRSAAGDREQVPQWARELVADGAEIILRTGDMAQSALGSTTGVPVVAFGLFQHYGPFLASINEQLNALATEARLAGLRVPRTPLARADEVIA